MTEKKYTDIDKQIIELKKRNMTINDTDLKYASDILKRNNYYNLINGYKDAFLEDKYKEGTDLKEIYSLYKFDKNISRLFFGYLLTIESLIKTVVSDVFSKQYGHKHYLIKENFDFTEDLSILSPSKKASILEKNSQISKLIEKLRKYIDNDKYATPYLIHYKNKHQYVPLWVLVNVLTFGDIVTFYYLMKQSERDKVANTLSLNKRINSKELDNFFSLLQDFRNKSAHDQRFYTIQTKNNRGIRYTIKFNDISYNSAQITHVPTSLFALVLTIKVLLEDEDFNIFFSTFIDELKRLEQNIKTIDVKHILDQMGFISTQLELDSIPKIEDFFNTVF